jgi:hypothetical protein
MALIVEDGTIVADANTFINREAAIAYAAERGITLANDETTDAKIIKAMDYLALYDQAWKGEQVEYGVQTLAWPRKYVYIGNSTTVFPSDQIPGQLVRAQAELVLQVNAGVNLLPTLSGDTAFVTREKVDVIETEYSEAMALKLAGLLPDMPLVDALLSPLFAVSNRLRTVRI